MRAGIEPMATAPSQPVCPGVGRSDHSAGSKNWLRDELTPGRSQLTPGQSCWLSAAASRFDPHSHSFSVSKSVPWRQESESVPLSDKGDRPWGEKAWEPRWQERRNGERWTHWLPSIELPEEGKGEWGIDCVLPMCVCVSQWKKVPDEWQARQVTPATLQVSSRKHNAKKKLIH